MTPAPLPRRLVAAIIDSVWISALGLAAYAIGSTSSPRVAAIVGAGSIAIVIVLTVLLEGGSRRASPGKQVSGLIVADEQSRLSIGYIRALLRVLGFAASGMLFYLPLLGALRRPSRQTWYDRSTGSMVVLLCKR
jgi:uncharacterized RDD family membrane protein YckC